MTAVCSQGQVEVVKSNLTWKVTSFWSSGTCIVLIPSMKFSVNCSLWRDSSIKGLKMLVKCLKS